MRRILCILLLLCVLPVVGCTNTVTMDEGKVHVVATTFPAYDFARAVVGDAGTVTMLISPGTETHSYDPSPQDIRKIQNCDLFIYGGGESDAWMDGILASIDMNIPTVAMTEVVSLLKSPHIENPDEEHHHEHSVYDEHVWTSPANAALIVAAVRDKLAKIDEDNADLYRAQAEAYIKEIETLDAEFADLVQNAPRKTVLFADRFPFLYFVNQYGLTYHAAYPGCAEKTEPGPKTVAMLIDMVRDESVPAVFYTEFSDQRLADAICEKTDAVKLLFHSCHNLSKKDFVAGETYVSLMRQNLNNLRKALY